MKRVLTKSVRKKLKVLAGVTAYSKGLSEESKYVVKVKTANKIGMIKLGACKRGVYKRLVKMYENNTLPPEVEQLL